MSDNESSSGKKHLVDVSGLLPQEMPRDSETPEMDEHTSKIKRTTTVIVAEMFPGHPHGWELAELLDKALLDDIDNFKELAQEVLICIINPENQTMIEIIRDSGMVIEITRILREMHLYSNNKKKNKALIDVSLQDYLKQKINSIAELVERVMPK